MTDAEEKAPVIQNITNHIMLGFESVPTFDGAGSVEEFLSFIDETSLIAQ